MQAAGITAGLIEIGPAKASSVDISPLPGLETARPGSALPPAGKIHLVIIGFANDRAGRGLSKHQGLFHEGP